MKPEEFIYIDKKTFCKYWLALRGAGKEMKGLFLKTYAMGKPPTALKTGE